MNPPVRILRESLLADLESAVPGLSETEQLEQSDCFCFRDGQVATFNEETCCRGSSGLPEDFQGAVGAARLLDFLRKSPDNELEVSYTAKSLILKGKGRRATLTLEKGISLPIQAVEKPGEWSRLDEDFLDALRLAGDCASQDPSDFPNCCVRVHPDYVEGFDGHQLLRYTLSTSVREPFLLPRTAAKHAGAMGMLEVCEGDNWVHFQNGSGLVLSTRRYLEHLPDLSSVLVCQGEQLSLPKGLIRAAEMAGDFASDSRDAHLIELRLRKDRLDIVGRGRAAKYDEIKKVNYSGPEISFLINPRLLAKVVKEHSSAQVSKERLLIDGGNWKCVVLLLRKDAIKEEEYD